MAKMTFQPKKISHARVHGFRARMATKGGRKVLSARRRKEIFQKYSRRGVPGQMLIWFSMRTVLICVWKMRQGKGLSTM